MTLWRNDFKTPQRIAAIDPVTILYGFKDSIWLW